MGRQGCQGRAYRRIDGLISAGCMTITWPGELIAPGHFRDNQRKQLAMDAIGEYLVVGFSGLTLLGTFAKDIFGGSAKLANKFHDMKDATKLEIDKLKETYSVEINNLKERYSAETSRIRTDFLQRSETYESNARVGNEAVVSNIHALREGLLEFRAKMAEEYMRNEHYNKATDELKRDFKEQKEELKSDMKDGFERVEKTLGEMTQAIELARKSRNAAHA